MLDGWELCLGYLTETVTECNNDVAESLPSALLHGDAATLSQMFSSTKKQLAQTMIRTLQLAQMKLDVEEGSCFAKYGPPFEASGGRVCKGQRSSLLFEYAKACKTVVW